MLPPSRDTRAASASIDREPSPTYSAPSGPKRITPAGSIPVNGARRSLRPDRIVRSTSRTRTRSARDRRRRPRSSTQRSATRQSLAPARLRVRRCRRRVRTKDCPRCRRQTRRHPDRRWMGPRARPRTCDRMDLRNVHRIQEIGRDRGIRHRAVRRGDRTVLWCGTRLPMPIRSRASRRRPGAQRRRARPFDDRRTGRRLQARA